MLRFGFNKPAGSTYNLLCLGAHCDDIEIGCGGTVLKILQTYEKVAVRWVVFSSGERRREEARKSAEAFLSGAKSTEIVIQDFRNSYFPYIAADIKEWFEGLKKQFSPDIVLTHYRDDLHQDHRVINELSWNSFRNHLILEYEIPKYDGDLGAPNTFVDLDRSIVDRKIQLLLECFTSQKDKHWFDAETFRSIMRLRGMESASNYAEAFYARKAILL
jgi:LmbE family N-acetylglucosaminyl deacetylase